jgi:hypothetical protein
MGLIDDVGKYVAFLAALGILAVLPLYLSQRRDVARLRAWMAQEPDYPLTDYAASEAALDRAETELETVYAERGEAVTATPAPATAPPPPTPAGGVTPIPPAQRVTGERPALERITMERAALEPHPRWRRFAARATQPRVLAVVGIVAVIVGVGAVLASNALLKENEPSGPHQRPGAVVPSRVDVSVLNGTSVPGLAGKVSDDVKANGFRLGSVSNSRKQVAQTVVMFETGKKRAAKLVAHDLGVTAVQPIDRTTQALAPGSDVVVIAGADRAKP